MTESKSRRRLSITKLQRRQASVAELINLCQTVTADGSLDDQEIAALREWADQNAQLDLPARDHLIGTIRRITADGFVTEDERRDLYLAIETILPPDIRFDVRGVRRSQEATASETARTTRLQAREEERAQRVLNKPIGRWNFMVAGVRYENRPEIIRRYVDPGDCVQIVREPTNRYSRNACRVVLENGETIGFIPEEHATIIASLADEGSKYRAHVTKVLTGGRAPIPVVQLDVFKPDAKSPDLKTVHILSTNVPGVGRARRDATSERSTLLLAAIIVVLVLITLWAVVA